MRRLPLRPGVALLTALLLAAPAALRAEDAKPPSALAKDLYDKASKAYKDKNYEDALAAYRELMDTYRSQNAVTSHLKEINERLDECEVQAGIVKRANQVFKGKAQLVGKNVLRLSYDFSDEAQLHDFEHFSAEGKIVDGELELSNPDPRGYFFWNLKNAIFEDAVSVDAQVSLPAGSDAEICVSAFFVYQTWSGYRFSLHYNDGDPFGGKARFINVVRKEAEKTELNFDKTHNLGTAAKPVIETGTKYRLKIVARQGTLALLLNNAPLITKQDKAYTKGLLRFGGRGGPVHFDNIQIEGQVNPDWLRKAFSEAETLAQRGKMDELKGKKEPELVPFLPLSVESKDTLSTVAVEAVKNHQEGIKYQVVEAFDKAIEQYSAALKIEPAFSASLVRRAQCWQHKGEEDKALEDLATAIAQHADFYEAYKERGDVHVGQGAFEDALNDYNKALELKPGWVGALAARGYLYFALGRRDDAMKEIAAALKAAPDDPEVKHVNGNLAHVAKGPPWRKEKTFVKETEHYLIKTDISDKAAAFYAGHLEAIHRLYSDRFGYKADTKQKARVYIFETREGYLTYAELSTNDRPEFTLGYYHPHYRELLLFEGLDKQETLRVIYHEGFHQFLAQLLPRPPYWFNEGVAEFFGASRVEGGVVKETGLIQEGRLRDVKGALEEGAAKKLTDIVNASPHEFYGGSPQDISIRYAQAWSLVHFLFTANDGKYAPLLRDYYKALRDGASQKQAYAAAFGKANMIALEKEWKEYVRKLELPRR